MAMKERETEQKGTPLAVCVNDCQLDYGQPRAQLAPVCFRVHCAFAEMRWGKAAEVDRVIPPPPRQFFRLAPAKC